VTTKDPAFEICAGGECALPAPPPAAATTVSSVDATAA
jgi:hypothetical protein